MKTKLFKDTLSKITQKQKMLNFPVFYKNNIFSFSKLMSKIPKLGDSISSAVIQTLHKSIIF